MTANIFDFADEWNDGGTVFVGIGLDVTDTASDAASKLLSLSVGGTEKFIVDKSGNIQVAADGSGTVNIGTGGVLSWGGDARIERVAGSAIGISGSGANESVLIGGAGGEVRVKSDGEIGWSSHASNAPSAAQDTSFQRDAVATVGVRPQTGNNPSTMNIYNTYTDAANYERVALGWSSNVFRIAPENAGTGSSRLLHISGLPTSNPGPGILWNDSGTVKVGT